MLGSKAAVGFLLILGKERYMGDGTVNKPLRTRGGVACRSWPPIIFLLFLFSNVSAYQTDWIVGQIGPLVRPHSAWSELMYKKANSPVTCLKVSELIDGKYGNEAEVGFGLFVPTFESGTAVSEDGTIRIGTMSNLKNLGIQLTNTVGAADGQEWSPILGYKKYMAKPSFVLRAYRPRWTADSQVMIIEFEEVEPKSIAMLLTVDSVGLKMGAIPFAVRGVAVAKDRLDTILGSATVHDIAVDNPAFVREIDWKFEKPVSKIVINGGGGGTLPPNGIQLWNLCYQ